VAQALDRLGLVSYNQGQYGQAWSLHRQSLAIWRALGELRGVALSLDNGGWVAHALGSFDQAHALFEESLG